MVLSKAGRDNYTTLLNMVAVPGLSFGFADEAKSGELIEPANIPPLPNRVPPDVSAEYSESELALRNLFVSEYLVDYDQVKAAQRIGFTRQFAIEYAKKFMDEPYVQQRLSALRTSEKVNQDDLHKYNSRRIVERLLHEAHFNGPGSSQAARVAALKALTDIHGMTSTAQGKMAAAKTGNGYAGGVMVVPAIADIDAWEAVAKDKQKALQDAAVEDQQ